ncbi:MAG: hypothetical protein K0Q50_2294 [Vampirovibrio sp.]|jgi:hypothetical protein|nr:hypothetical protein [Vampirovibrio sp.]
MDTILQPLLAEHLKNRMLAAHETNTALATALQDEDALRTLSECETKLNTLFAGQSGGAESLGAVMGESYQVIQRLGQCQEQLGKKVKKGSSAQAQDIRDKAKKTVEEAKDFINYCREQGDDGCGPDNKHDEEQARRLRQEMKDEIKAPCKVYQDEEVLQHLDGWGCKLDMLSPELKFISPELAREFFEKLQMDIKRMSVEVCNRQEQQDSLANLLKIRQSMFSLQTSLLNRVYLDQPLAARK